MQDKRGERKRGYESNDRVLVFAWRKCAKRERYGDDFLRTRSKKEVTLDCIESGSTLRFMIPVALASGAEKITFNGSERLIARGVEVYEEVFADKGVRIEKGKKEIVVSGTLESGNYVLRGDVSSQYVTGLMLSLATLNSDSTIEILPPVESRPYIDMTIAVLEKFGVKIEETEKNKFFVKGGQCFASGAYDVEGDWSNGAILFALNAFGSNVAVSGLDENSVQGDKVCVEIFRALEKGMRRLICPIVPTLRR